MKRIFISTLLGFSLLLSHVRADEGMWLLPLLEKLNYSTMKDMGLELTPEQIYSINNSSLKDAIANFWTGLTSEVISQEGLLLTNHHCGYDEIQSHTTLENDVLGEGFWANSKEDELPNPGLSATFLIRIEEVTDKVLADINDEMSETERSEKIRGVAKELSDAATADNHYRAMVRSFFDNNKYYLFVYETYEDVRLVGTPPESIGKFGKDTDNWQWPRHTGDFSLFRIYMSPDGKPAEYSEENIPFKPKHHLPISLKGIEKGDFTMILGYPGGTDRYITSWGVEQLMEVTHPNRIKIRGIRQDILKEDMNADKEVYNKYASKYARSSNYWKYSIGQSKGIKRLKVIERKREEESAFEAWIQSDEALKSRYNDVLADIENFYKDSKPYMHNLQVMSEVFRATEIFQAAKNTFDLAEFLLNEKTDTEAFNEELADLKKKMDKFFKDYNKPTDMKVTRAMLELYAAMVPADQHPDFYETINGKFKGDYDKYVEKLFSKSIFTDKNKVDNFLSNPSWKVLSKDPAYIAAKSIGASTFMERNQYRAISEDFRRARRLYTEGMLKMDTSRAYYPDANFTMRLTYGTVSDYYPADAVHYDYITYLKGVMEKEGPAGGEFEVPAKLKELYKAKDYGRYGVDGKMPVCFLSNNDITGGNSGSPVINGKGELIGLAFDGNWEAMSGDIVFENELQKTISVDIRYVLFIMDKYAGATNLIEELTIVE
jgi:hypothetical protein